MEILRALIVDDERLARVGIRRELEAMGGIEVVGECGSGGEAVRAIRSQEPDVVLLDVRMPGMDGFEVVREVGVEAMPPVIFVTAHDEHALRAFEVDAVDYVLKPVEPGRFERSVRRVAERLRGRAAGTGGSGEEAGPEDATGHDEGPGRSGAGGAPEAAGKREAAARLEHVLERLEALRPGGDDRAADGAGEDTTAPGAAPLERLAVEKGGRISLVATSDIRWVEAAGNYVRVHAGDESYLVRRTMKSLEEDLDPHTFLRIRRSAIVNMERVDHLELAEDGRHRIELDDGTGLRASRRHGPAVTDFLRRYR